MKMTFGEKLLKLRSDAGLSQDKLAEMLEVSRQSVSKWERDEAMPDTDKIVLISKIFSVSTDSLLKDEDEIKTAGEGTDGTVKEETAQITSDAVSAANGDLEDDAKRFERGSLMDFLYEIVKVIKRHLSLFGVCVVVSQMAGLAATIFNAASVYNNSDFDKTFVGILYNSLHMGSGGALLGILTGVALIVLGAVLRRKAGAENE